MSDQSGIVMLVTVCMGLMKFLDHLVEWGIHRFSGGKNGKNGHSTVVHLDPETSRLLNELHTKTSAVTEILSAKDQDGAPMVYYPRSLTEDLRQVADILRDISYTQKLLIDRLETRMPEAHVIRR